VPAEEPEQGTNVAVIKGVADVVALPEPWGTWSGSNALDAMSRAPEVVTSVMW
jgi:hypothetical protein